MRAGFLMWLLVVGVLLAVAQQARAQPLFAHADSIESTVANADLVFIATLVDFREGEQRDGREAHGTTIAVEETLKKDLFRIEPYGRIQMNMPHNMSVLADWKQRSSRLLVAYDECAPYATTVIELVPGRMEILKADFTLLRDPEAVIRAAEKRLRGMPEGVRRLHNFRLQVPRETVAETKWDEYYATGGYLLLSVPVDEQLEKRAIEYMHSERYGKRKEGARALRYFKSEKNILRVRELLDDPGWAHVYRAQENSGIEVRFYGVRQEAYRTLEFWGVKVDKPLIRDEVQKSSR